ncbi:MAG: sulfatase [Kibdelosporangium sp.]
MTTDSRPDRRRRVLRRVITALAVVFVLLALVVPNDLSRLTPGEFLRIPLEGLLGAALILALPAKPRRVVAAAAGAALGLLLIVKFLDMGFNQTLGRTFDPLFDWSFLGPGLDFLGSAVGRTGAIAIAVGAGILVVAVVVLMALAAMRVTRLAVGRRTATTRTVAVLTVVWIFAAAFGLPIAAKDTAAIAYAHAGQVRVGLKDHQAFTAEVSADAFRGTPGDELLTGLRGKDVMLTFVESYGRVAIEGQDIAPQVDAVLDAGTAKLRAAGFSARSAFLTSSTFGGGSWLAHSTTQSGVWINNQQRYDNLLAGDRLTLSGAFKRAGWRTVGQMPQHTMDWPEGKYYGYDQYYDGRNVGYQGPNFFYAAMPDQYTLSAFQRLERSTPGHAPVMAEIALVSSHTPWTPVADLIDWNDVGDGAVFKPMPDKGKKMEDVWPDPVKVRAAYTESIQYSLNTLISYVQTYGDDNLVLVFLGDHQPAPIVAGDNATRDVPITIVARDPAVLDKVTGWGWQDGLNPSPNAPVWPMNSFRDRFLTAFGPNAGQSKPAH